MKSISLGLFFQVLTIATFAQDVRTEKKTLSRNLDEVYQVYTTDKKVKVGPYKVVDEDKHILAVGIYKDGRKDSLWTYYNIWAEPVQQFDFTNDRLIYDGYDSATIVHSHYQLDGKLGDSDEVQPPYKIGGVNYGFYLLYDAREIPQDVKSGSDGASLNYVFNISEKGELTGWKVIYKGKMFNDIIQEKSIKGLPADAYEFTPATVNGHAVNSRLIFSVSLDVNHVETGSTNNIVTQHGNN